MKKKNIIISIIVAVLLIACIKPAYMFYQYKQEQKRLSQEPFFTEYHITYGEFHAMVKRYYVNENPFYMDELDKSHWPDYSYYTMEPTEDTEMVVTVLNHWLFDEFSEWDLAALKKAEEYGFSSENRITVEWVMTHPKEAVEIVNSTANRGDIFDDYQWIKKVYEEITGTTTTEN